MQMLGISYFNTHLFLTILLTGGCWAGGGVPRFVGRVVGVGALRSKSIVSRRSLLKRRFLQANNLVKVPKLTSPCIPFTWLRPESCILRQESDKEKITILIKVKSNQGCFGMSEPLKLVLKPNSVTIIHSFHLGFYFCFHLFLLLSSIRWSIQNVRQFFNVRFLGSGSHGVSQQGLKESKMG